MGQDPKIGDSIRPAIFWRLPWFLDVNSAQSETRFKEGWTARVKRVSLWYSPRRFSREGGGNDRAGQQREGVLRYPSAAVPGGRRQEHPSGVPIRAGR